MNAAPQGVGLRNGKKCQGRRTRPISRPLGYKKSVFRPGIESEEMKRTNNARLPSEGPCHRSTSAAEVMAEHEESESLFYVVFGVKLHRRCSRLSPSAIRFRA